MKKLILFFAIVWGITVCHSYGQEAFSSDSSGCTVNMTLKRVPLTTVLESLDSQCVVKFSYNNDQVPFQEIVSVSAKGVPLAAFLDDLSECFAISYVQTTKHIVLRKSRMKQAKKGKIITRTPSLSVVDASEQGEDNPLPKELFPEENDDFRVEEFQTAGNAVEMKNMSVEPATVPRILAGYEKKTIWDAELRRRIVKLDEVVVTADTSPSHPLNQMATISSRSFSEEDLARFPASFGDPARLASAFAGVVAGADATNEIIIRGNSPREMQWRIEGMEIPGPNHFSEEAATSGTISMMSANTIGRSDFFTGAFPAQYGNANSGVLDIWLRNGNDERIENSVELSLIGVDVASEGPISKKNNSSYLINYRFSTLGLLDAITDVQDENMKEGFQDLTFKFNFPTKNKGTFSFFGLGGLSNSEEFTNGNLTSLIVYDMGAMGLNHQINPAEDLNVKTQLGISGTTSLDVFVERWPDNELHVQEADLAKSYLHFSNTVSKYFSASNYTEAGVIYRKLGYDFFQRRQYPDNQPVFQDLTFFDEQGNTYTLQTFLSTKHQVSKNFTLIGGVHLFHFGLNNEWNVEPRAGFTWKAHDDGVISGGFGMHSRLAPLQYYLANDFEMDGTPVQRNRSLRSSKSRHYVLGYERRLTSSLSAKVEAYYQDLYDTPELAAPGLEFYSVILSPNGFINEALINTGKGENFGVEVSAEKTFTKGYFFLFNWAQYEATYTNRDGTKRNSVYNGNYAVNFVGGKEWSVGRRKNNTVAFNLKAALAGNRRFIPSQLVNDTYLPNYELAYEQRLPDFSRIDVQVSYRLINPKTTLEWRLGVQNLFGRINADQQYVDFNLIRRQDINGFQTQQRGNQLGAFPLIGFRVGF